MSFISRKSRKVMNTALSAVLALTVTVWLGGFAFVAAPSVQAQSLAESIAAIQAQIAALTAQLNALLVGSGSGSGAGVGLLTQNLSQGSTGAEVTILQNGLKLDVAVYPEGLVTGFFGPLTRAAVVRFQEKYASEVLAPVGLSSGTGFVGSQTRAKFNALYGSGTGTGPGPVIPSGNQILISLAAQNPLAGVTPKSASNVAFLAFNVTAPSSGAIRVDSIIVHRAGAGAPADFDNVYLYEGDTRLTTGRSVNTSTNNSEFHSLNLNVNAGQTRTLWVTADLSSAAGAGNQNYFEIVSAASLVGSASVAGSFPIRGNAISVANAAAGQVTVDTPIDGTSPKVGETNRNIGSFRLTASSTEDVEVRRVALFQAGSVSRSALTNLRLMHVGQQVASVSGVNDKDLAVFVFNPPFLVEKGNSRTFEIWTDIAAGAKNNDTIKFYVDEKTDVLAVGRTYGRGVTVVNTAFDGGTPDTDEVDVTVEGGQLTITFNGPAAKDMAPDAEDVEVLNFTMAAGANLEIRDLLIRLTGNANNTDDYDDVKVVNVTKGIVVMGPTDITTATTTTDITYTDRFTMNAGESNVFSIRADIAPTGSVSDGQTLRVDLGQGTTAPFGSNSVRNLDNNQFISDIVPSGVITGNTHTVRSTSLTLSLAGTPTSQSFVRGTSNVDLVGLNFKAGVAQDITLTSVKVTGFGDDTASGIFVAGQVTTTTSVASRVGSVRLIDQSTGGQQGNLESVNSTSGEAQFSSLNFLIPAGQTKTLLVRANLDAAALSNSDADRVKFDIVAVGDVVARDPQGNSVSIGSFSAPNSTTTDSGTRITISDAGSIAAAIAPDDSESEAGLVVAGKSNVVLAKYRFTATSEELKVTKVQFSVSSTSLQEVTSISVWDGSTMLASQTPALGTASGTAAFTNLNFIVPKDASKTLTVKGDLNTTPNGATSGDEIQVFLDDANFEARGTAGGSSTVLDSSSFTGDIAANTKFVRKTVPTVSFAAGDNLLTTGEKSLMKITISADSNEQISVRTFNFVLAVSNATFDIAADGFKVREGGNLLTSTSSNSQSAATITLTSVSQIPAGGSKTYEILGTVTSAGAGSASVTIKMNQSTTEVGPAAEQTVANNASTLDFTWSDASIVGGGVISSADWYNGFKVKTLPSSTFVLSKS